MSDTTGTGTGGAAAPGWYADPHDPQQLRWWSGAAWTEHVSPKTAPAEPAAAATAEPAAQPAEQPAATQPAAQQVTPEVSQPAATDPLPSRRALRESSAEAAADPAAAQSAWDQASQAAVQASQPVQPAQPDQFPQQAETSQPSLYEQRAATNAGIAADVPVQPALVEPELTQPTAGQPSAGQPTADQIAWNQQTPQAAEPAQTQQPPVVQPAQTFQTADAAAQNLWNQTPPATAPDWNQPAAAATPASAMDGLFGNQPAATPGTPDAALPGIDAGGGAPAAATAGQWGLTPSTRRSGAPAAADVASTSTLWVWLVAVSPIIAAILIGLAIASSTTGIDFTNWMLPAAIVVPYLLVILFAVADRSRLTTLGVEAPATWTFAALSAPVYLIARAGVLRRETGNGGPGLIVWLICFVVAIAGFVGYGFLGNGPLIPGLPG